MLINNPCITFTHAHALYAFHSRGLCRTLYGNCLIAQNVKCSYFFLVYLFMGKRSNEFRPRTDSSPRVSIGRASDIPSVSGVPVQPPKPLAKGMSQDVSWKSVHLATFMDVAVLRCLFIPHWEEEGVHWGVTYMLKR